MGITTKSDEEQLECNVFQVKTPGMRLTLNFLVYIES